MYVHDTIVAPATAPGVGAVAIIRLSGPAAIEILRSIWRPARAGTLKTRHLYIGDIRDPVTDVAIDRALAVIMPGPRSLTGEDVVELHCHGGPFLVRRIMGLVMGRGARMAERGEFSRRALLNGRIDLTAAEAVADLDLGAQRKRPGAGVVASQWRAEASRGGPARAADRDCGPSGSRNRLQRRGYRAALAPGDRAAHR